MKNDTNKKSFLAPIEKAQGYLIVSSYRRGSPFVWGRSVGASMKGAMKLSEIKDSGAKRDHGKQEFQDLKSSISIHGLIEPLVVNQDNKLLCGRRRFQACKELGFTEVPVRVIKTKNELEEFDIALEENIKRKQLTPLEEGQALLERKKIYEQLHPETKQGGDRKSIKTQQLRLDPKNDKLSFSEDTAKRFNVSRRTIETQMQAARLVEDTPSLAKFETVKKILLESKKKNIRKELEETEFPKGKFNVIYADPPWQFSNSGFEESADSHYKTMPTADICKMPMSDLITRQGILFLWATNAMLEDALRVCQEWGFKYKTNFAWVKDKGPSIGWFTKSRHELLLVATRGDGMHPQEKFVSWFQGEVTKHSKKPEKVYEMIEKMYEGPYLEMFGRNERKGWKVYGNQVAKS